ncbi:thermonuclease family protein [Devosia epidermidihirudinis]|nr:thermonuclease family protein [Devosia epidermidihirudinis]
MAAAWLDTPPPPIAGMARASDGDSLRLGDERVRILDIDAPELAQNCTETNGRVWSCGKAARDRMAALLASGIVDCRPEGKDQYGRLLARCVVGGRDIGATMVSEGLAVSYGGYAREEAAARKARLGIWGGDFDAPKAWRDDHPRPQGIMNWLSGFGV